MMFHMLSINHLTMISSARNGTSSVCGSYATSTLMDRIARTYRNAHRPFRSEYQACALRRGNTVYIAVPARPHVDASFMFDRA